MAKRKKIAQNVQNEITTRSGRRCCLCFGINNDLKPKGGQIAHLDRNPENDDPDNLAWLCLEHHDAYDSKTSQSKGFAIGEVKQYRDELYQAIEQARQNALAQSPSQGKVYVWVGGPILVALVIFVIWYLATSSRRSAACNQPIRTATATIEITVTSDEDINTTYIDRGAYVAFGRESESLLMMSSSQCRARQTGKGQVIYHAVVNMDVSDAAFGKAMRLLEEAEYIQIRFLPMPEQSQVVVGKVTCIFNGGEIVLEMNVPAQKTTEGKIFGRGLHLKCGPD